MRSILRIFRTKRGKGKVEIIGGCNSEEEMVLEREDYY